MSAVFDFLLWLRPWLASLFAATPATEQTPAKPKPKPILTIVEDKGDKGGQGDAYQRMIAGTLLDVQGDPNDPLSWPTQEETDDFRRVRAEVEASRGGGICTGQSTPPITAFGHQWSDYRDFRRYQTRRVYELLSDGFRHDIVARKTYLDQYGVADLAAEYGFNSFEGELP